MRWTLIIPAKALPAAKSRLRPGTSDPAHHRDLVIAIRTDTVAAARAAEGVARVVIVTDRASNEGWVDAWDDEVSGPGGRLEPVVRLVQSRPGLNEALDEAAEQAMYRWPGDAVAALVGDLPALRPAELAAALGAAGDHARSFVADAAGTGTTLLTAARGIALSPGFGVGSAARHRSRAVELTAGAGLRHDVDVTDDLVSAARLTLGPATAAAVARTGVIVSSP